MTGDNSIGASATRTIQIDNDWGDNDPNFVAGNSYTLKFTFADGKILTMIGTAT